ncbi:c-type cytochrome, partial [Steroidobacter sp.]|uniref:c-type cytochrome n=1 Tax=Steroidobacter sp. TaxID=1978227 RepID=UPI001A409C5B
MTSAAWFEAAQKLVCLLMLAILPVNVIADATDRRAALNYMLHCQGCHKDDGSGQPGYVPDLRGSIARFLHVPEGR